MKEDFVAFWEDNIIVEWSILMNFGGRKLEPVCTKPDSIIASANLSTIV